MLDRIRRLLVEKIDVPRELDEIDPDTPLFGTGLALDSIDAVDLLVQLGSEFGVDIQSDEEGRIALRTVNSLVDLALEAEASGDGRG
ncbi:MAG: phosphopantetheine-binding protein [Longimicrobiales bacterium]|nr:phosphopantetheine-binding protein [Longimicrobiales bacterium]